MGDAQPDRADRLDDTVLLRVLTDVAAGDFSVRMPIGWTGTAGKIADSLNEVLAANETLETELARAARIIGTEGRLSQRVRFRGTGRAWSETVESVNTLIDELVRPTTEMQRVIGAVADGDLSRKITADVRGEMLELKTTINAMVDQLNGFASEMTRVAREVGTEGRLGQAAAVTIGVGGVWKDLTDGVNVMAGNLTRQVRDIAEVTTAVANGDLSKKITTDVQGEFLDLKNTVNTMVDQLNRFTSEVSRVAREVGIEGKLGGQAQSAEVAGVWKDLTDNVNQLAANLTSQVRAIAEVATAVTDGDLTRQVGVKTAGEVAVLKDTLNEMIRNLRATTQENTEQDWLKTNLERFSRMLQGHRDLDTVSRMILSELAPLVTAQHGVLYTLETDEDGAAAFELRAGYGYKERKNVPTRFRAGEGLVGQCVLEKQAILLSDVPADYVRVSSGLGEATPLNIIVLPIIFERSVRAVVELASFSRFTPIHQAFLDRVTESIGLVLNTIEANTLTETLLAQAQSHAQELLVQNQEIEEKADQLAVSSRYKSEFFANMSHELRTPLNSLLMLADELRTNATRNLSDDQVQSAGVIHESGTDLLRLLDDILDHAKAESGTVALDISNQSLQRLREGLERDFRHVAERQGLEFGVDLSPGAPTGIVTDPGRLRQILKNLLSNAFKFTERGEVRLTIGPPAPGWTPTVDTLGPAGVVMFNVHDTGIGVPPELHEEIFEAFAQADGTAARQYGGTGLGLAISRELVGLLGGEIAIDSTPGEGSTFTVYLPAGSGAVVDAPAAPGEPAVTVAEPGHPAGGGMAGLKALVVDDDVRAIFALRTVLERGGFEVLSAESGAEGVAILQRTDHIDIVLVDVMMPVMDGYATMRAMREQPWLGPIVALTAQTASATRARCLEAGASTYVPKPVATSDLMFVLGEWLLTPGEWRAPNGATRA
jgi:signal transduction histidine kinase/HAMP domain-containing protein